MSAELFHNSKTSDLARDQGKVKEVFRLYSMLAASCPLDAQCGLGGKLVYAGAISDSSNASHLLYAANIAGAASLGASADPAALRQAMRDGVVDFLVNSLDEALRILKNEIRKRQAVSVGVAAEPDQLVEQMLERGVLPDLLPHPLAAIERFVAQGSRQIVFSADGTDVDAGAFLRWSVPVARWLLPLNACAVSVLPAEDVVRRRWLRLAPRYLGRLMQRQHGVFLSAAEELLFRAEVERLVARLTAEGEEPVQLTISD